MKRALLAIFLAVFLWHVYRSAATAVTIGEAITYNQFASQHLLTILTAPYHPSNQVLHSLLCYLVLHIFRVTEFSLRIPSLFGLLFYFWAAFQLVSPQTAAGRFALLIFAVNPFTIGWLPESTGVWMAGGFFLLALRQLVNFDGTARCLSAASIELGLAIAFYNSFLVPSVTLVFIILHFEFWGSRRITSKLLVNNLVLPAGILVFTLWILPLLKGSPETLSLPQLLSMDWVILLPGLGAILLVILVQRRAAWRVYGSMVLVMGIVLLAFPQFGLGWVPNRFQVGPQAAMPYVARALRDDLRRNPPLRTVRVGVSTQLIDSFEFYRHRYALGAVQKSTPNRMVQAPDYSILLDDPKRDSDLFAKGRISLRLNHSP